MSWVAGIVEGYRSGRCAGYLAVALAVALPWSTSATAALISLWFLAYLPLFNFGAISREVFSWRGGLPLLLCAWAALGLLWSDASWADSVNALRQYQKIIFIPLALAYFRHSDYGIAVMIGFAVSCMALLLVALIVTVWPDVQWWHSRDPGVPAKTYITQSAVFAICAFCLFYLSVDAWKKKSRGFAIITLVIALTFIGDILFVITSRTELVVISVLVILFGVRFYGWRGSLLGLMALALLIVFAWNTSGYLRSRIQETKQDLQTYLSKRAIPAPESTTSTEKISSTEYRMEFLRRSFGFIATAPVLGHGTGSIKLLFDQTAASKTGVSAVVTGNPHNQIVTVTIQLGIIGAVLLCAMWIVHALIFVGPGMLSWFGLVIVAQIVVGSLFNNHLFDFTEGWLYVCGIGVLGGTCLRQENVRAGIISSEH